MCDNPSKSICKIDDDAARLVIKQKTNRVMSFGEGEEEEEEG